MDEIAKITLDNEMDLILAHKRSMKLAEIAGLSLSAQTSFATAVSEVARTAIEGNKRTSLHLGVDTGKRDKYIVASIADQHASEQSNKGLQYASRLVNKYQVSTSGGKTAIELFYAISPAFKTDIQKLDEWRTLFRNEQPVSPYDEIKRKNEQLQELSDKLQKSEEEYKTLTNALPLIIFSMSEEGQLLYANEWLTTYTGETMARLNATRWKNVVHPDDFEDFSLLLRPGAVKGAMAIQAQARLRHKNEEDYFWHQLSVTPFRNELKEIQYWIGYIVDIHAQKVFEETLKDNAELKVAQQQLKDNQQTLENFIAELNRSNQELQQFAFVASHDLQEPVRKLLYYSDYLLNRYSDVIDARGASFLRSMQSSSQRMRNLIQDLLLFSQVNREKLQFSEVDLDMVANEVLQDLEMMISEKKAVMNIDSLPVVTADLRMMRQLFENLLNNALKYASPDRQPVISVTCSTAGDYHEITVTDNGIGFDEKYLPRMFTLFQRLHTKQEYDGTGLGLAICLKIMEIHEGKIWARSEEGAGARFSISLPVSKVIPVSHADV